MINRMIFTKKLAKCEIPYLGVIDFEAYKDIYVYCDSDPIGYYLNYKHIYYHALEDGLDCLKNDDDAYHANYGHFGLKAWFSAHNLRHTFCTRLCEHETNLKVIQEIMGHSDIQTTMNVYAEATEQRKKDVFANLENKIKIS